jgi:hypothetical protein
MAVNNNHTPTQSQQVLVLPNVVCFAEKQHKNNPNRMVFGLTQAKVEPTIYLPPYM